MGKKLWGGRFEGETNEFADEFGASVSFDRRMIKEDIEGSIAHAAMLGKCGVISQSEAVEIVNGLKAVLKDIEEGKSDFSPDDEDVHMNVERLLTQKIGDAGKKLHTGRSRNDQVATDIRLHLRRQIDCITAALKKLCGVMTDIASNHLTTIMPAYTHMQKAQPTTLAHWCMAYFEMFYRDILRFNDCRARMNVSPLGSGALCGAAYPLDREYTAEILGFDDITRNSMDGVSDRDFAIEFLSCASICMMHLSRICEEIILFSTNEFAVIRLNDAYSTGSSIMPQKKNPDMAELIRGKTGRVYGDLIALLTVMKGLPLAYNKDMQEDKEPVFDAADTLLGCLKIMAPMLKTAKFDAKRLKASAALGYTNATDAADYLVKKGMAFRDAHEAVGKMVLYCEKKGVPIDALTIDKVNNFAPIAGDDFYAAISPEACINARALPGGPAPDAVKAHIERARKLLEGIN